MITIKGLTKTFAEKATTLYALNHVSFTINDGEIFGIIGLSGAGKSTLMRCLAGLETPSAGSIRMDDQIISELKAKKLRQFRSNIGVVFQGYHLLMQQTVFNNIAFPLRMRKYKKTEIKKRVTELIQMVGLDAKVDAYPASLSGGQKQRVAIARALATNPKLLLLDELTSALDPITTKQVLELLQQINQTYHVTMLLITHEMSVIKAICHQVAVLNYGEIVEIGTSDDVLCHPQHEMTNMLLGR